MSYLSGRISSDEESEIEFFTKPVHGGKKFKKKATKNKKNLQVRTASPKMWLKSVIFIATGALSYETSQKREQ